MRWRWIALGSGGTLPRFPGPKDARSPLAKSHGASALGAFNQGPAELTSSRVIWEVSTAWRKPRSAAAAVIVGYWSTISNRLNRAAPPIWLRAGRSIAGACLPCLAASRLAALLASPRGRRWMPCRCAHKDVSWWTCLSRPPALAGCGGARCTRCRASCGRSPHETGVYPPGVDSVSVGKMGDCLAVDAVARGDVTQGHTLLVVVGNQNLRR